MIYFDSFSHEIFQPYIAHFAKQKIISSPFPVHCAQTPAARQAYLHACSVQLGITITEQEMRQCSATRAISKLFLNTLWVRVCVVPFIMFQYNNVIHC